MNALDIHSTRCLFYFSHLINPCLPNSLTITKFSPYKIRLRLNSYGRSSAAAIQEQRQPTAGGCRERLGMGRGHQEKKETRDVSGLHGMPKESNETRGVCGRLARARQAGHGRRIVVPVRASGGPPAVRVWSFSLPSHYPSVHPFSSRVHLLISSASTTHPSRSELHPRGLHSSHWQSRLVAFLDRLLPCSFPQHAALYSRHFFFYVLTRSSALSSTTSKNIQKHCKIHSTS